MSSGLLIPRGRWAMPSLEPMRVRTSLAGVQVHPETPLIPAGHGLPELAHAGVGRVVVGFGVLHQLDHLIDDEAGRGQVRVADPQVNDIHPPGLDFGLLVVDSFKEIGRNQAQACRGFKKIRHLCCPFCNEVILQGADTFHPDFHHVAGLHGADPRGCAGGDDVAGQQGHDLGNEGYLRRNPEDQVPGVGVLPALPIQIGLHREIARVRESPFRSRGPGARRYQNPWPGSTARLFAANPGQ